MKDLTIAEQHKLIVLAHSVMLEAHKGQKRKDGKDYSTHLEAVADIVINEYFSLIPQNEACQDNWGPMKLFVVMAALLHDSIEDTDMTAEKLREFGFPEMVVDIVETVTKRAGETYFDFIMRIHGSGNVGAKVVKLADLAHNMSDLKEGAQKDKYRFAQYLLSYFNKPVYEKENA